MGGVCELPYAVGNEVLDELKLITAQQTNSQIY